MRDEPVRLGFLSLLMIVIVLCLAVLSVLSLATARADLALAKKQAQVQQDTAALDALGQEWFAQVARGAQDGAGALPQGTGVANGVASTTLEANGRQLYAAVRLDDLSVVAWQQSAKWQPGGQTEKLWGN